MCLPIHREIMVEENSCMQVYISFIPKNLKIGCSSEIAQPITNKLTQDFILKDHELL